MISLLGRHENSQAFLTDINKPPLKAAFPLFWQPVPDQEQTSMHLDGDAGNAYNEFLIPKLLTGVMQALYHPV
jgi:hypothetical protein